MKTINPYTNLKQRCKEWARQVIFPPVKAMWQYPKAKLSDGWNLANLNERVAAAEQLGWDVVLKSEKEGLTVQYRKKVPVAPYEIQ